MATNKQRKEGTRTRSASPPSAPLLPPAPSQAKNRGASPRPFADEPPIKLPTQTRIRSKAGPIQAPPAVADGHELARATVPVSGTKLESARRLLMLLFVGYLGYSLYFVCPSLDHHRSNAICDGVTQFQDWLRPYSGPVLQRLDGTYRTYAEPYVKQYGEPLYQQGQKYYVEVAQPAFVATTDKARSSYNQYAHPHVNKAVNTIYTDNVKAHVGRVQKSLDGCHKHVQNRLVDVKKMSMDAKNHANHLYSIHVQPVFDRVTPHAKTAWNHASTGANKAHGTANVLYMKHINPYAQQTWTVVMDSAGNIKESFARHTDEIWGTRFSKQNQSKPGRAARRAAEKARWTERKAQEAAKKAKFEAEQAKADAEAHAKGVKDTLLRRAEEYVESAKEALQETVSGAQKVVGEYSDTIKAAVLGKTGAHKKATDQASKIPSAEEIKAAAVEKGQNAHKGAEQFVKTVTEAATKKAQKVEQVVVDEAEYLRRLADEREHEAGKLPENIKKTVIEKAHEAQEAVAHQASNIRHAVQDAGAYIVDSVTGASHDAKEAIKNEADHLAKLAGEKKENMERLAKQEAAALKHAALEKEMETRKAAEDAIIKAQGTYDAAGQRAEDIKTKVKGASKDAEKAAGEKVETIKKAAEDATTKAQGACDAAGQRAECIKAKVKGASKDAEEVAGEKVETIKKAAQEYTESFQDSAKDQFDNIKLSADQIVMSGKEQVNRGQEYVSHKVKDAGQQVEHAKDDVKHKAHDAHTAAKTSLEAMLTGIEATFGKFYEYEEDETKNLQSKLQSAINEHITGAKEAARNLERTNHEAYEAFESYVKDWRNQGGNLEERLSKLSQNSVDSIKKIGQKAEEEQAAAKSKAQVLSNNVEVYLTGFWDILSDRLAASKVTVVSDLNVFKDTSSKDDDKTLRGKLEELERSARTRLESTGSNTRNKAQELLKQVEEIWSQSEAKSREYVERTRELALKAREDVKASVLAATGGGSEKVADIFHEKKGLPEGGPAGLIADEPEPNVRIATEEPGSGHRHHRH
ncbi:hypothetical protein BGZ65_000610 [Modicella reniformis]|uniref:Uncharacterized protein n=1 Tax=Modicella reniformis TaxID=1440133 RepID=A0A9P6M0Y8_9FUNG|nr:hypothetical protein BGZ65_000610 [Modicella reniformis]